MRPTELKFSDPQLQKMFNEFRSVLGNISKDNLKYEIVEGKTSSTADTKAMFRHGLNSVPNLWLPLEGDVYIASKGFSETEVDVRSRLTSHIFKILVIR